MNGPNETQDRDKDARLDAVLREWQAKSPLPPRFHEEVWKRIDRLEGGRRNVARWQLVAAWFRTKLPRSAMAATSVALLLVIGAGIGWSQARRETARVANVLSARYAQTVDPYGAP